MRRQYRTSKGAIVDVDALRVANERTIAVGNMRTNASGDVIGKGGKVIKRRDEIAKEYYRDNPRAVKNASIKDRIVEEDRPEEQEEDQDDLKPRGSKKGSQPRKNALRQRKDDKR